MIDIYLPHALALSYTLLMKFSNEFEQIFQLKSGWVFNPWLDFMAFFIPLLLAFFFKLTSTIDILVLKATFEIGHLFVTILPLYFLSKAGEVNMKPVFLKPLLILFAAETICYFNFQFFTYVFGYYALFHICAQLYGWLARVQRKSQPATKEFDIIFERVFLVALLMSSVLFWHTSYSAMQKSWFYEHNLVLPVPQEVWKIVDFIFWSLLAVWSLRQFINFFVRKEFPVGKILLLLSVWLMFYFSLVINHSGQYGANFFWFVITMNHGISYILLIFTTSRPKEKSKTVPYFVLYILGIFLTGLIWNKFIKYSITLDVRFAAILVWGPLILHYAIDSIIWKRSFLNERLLNIRTL